MKQFLIFALPFIILFSGCSAEDSVSVAADKVFDLAKTQYTLMDNALGENGFFLLKHCVGNMPENNEIDVPLSYADYYFLEAQIRYVTLKEKE